jgi:hypothetical protein
LEGRVAEDTHHRPGQSGADRQHGTLYHGRGRRPLDFHVFKKPEVAEAPMAGEGNAHPVGTHPLARVDQQTVDVRPGEAGVLEGGRDRLTGQGSRLTTRPQRHRGESKPDQGGLGHATLSNTARRPGSSTDTPTEASWLMNTTVRL